MWPRKMRHRRLRGRDLDRRRRRRDYRAAEQSLKPGGMLLIGEPYWRQVPATEEIAQACGASSLADFLTLADLVSSYDALGYDLVEMVLADQEGWDRYEAAKWLTMRRWLEETPMMSLCQKSGRS